LNRRSFATALVAAGLAGHAFFVPISIAGTQIALGVALVGLVLDPPKPLRSPLDWPALAFVLICVASDLLSPYGPPSLAFATLWRALIGFFVVFHGLRKLTSVWPARLIVCAAIGLSLASIVGLVQYRSGVDIVYLLHLRAQPALVEAPGVPGRYGALGFFTSRLTFGHVATVVTALVAGSLASGAARSRLLWIAVALGLVAIALTFDRGAYLGVLAAIAAIVLLSEDRARIALGAALVAIAAMLVPGVRARFISSFSAEGKGNADRLFIWARAREIIADHPLRGIGFGNYPRVCGAYYDRYDPQFFMRTWAHNLELSTLAETGPLGLLALFWLFGATLVTMVQKRAAGGLAAVCAFLALAQVHDALYDNKVMYAVWLAAALGASAGSPKATAG
jgi:putative inorganic carbon (HCO3(-)) transporter